MVTHTERAAAVALGAISILFLATACDKVPLLAPTASVINLYPSSSTVPLNGEMQIVVTVIKNGVAGSPASAPGARPVAGTPTTTPTPTPVTTTTTAGAGTPVQNGTLVSFTATLGRIEPTEALTSNGQVHVKFIAGSQSGISTITAFSGGASGKLENLKVGTAALDHVLITASPQTLGPSGGTSTITARVEDASGFGLSGISVNFSTDAGTLSSSTGVTDGTGVATTTLTTSRPAKVTANVAGKTADVSITLNPRTGVTLSGPTSPVSAGTPATFTVGVGSSANIRNVAVDFGDGDQRSLGAISGSTTIQHTYAEAGTYTVSATATEASGFTETVSTAVTILPGQPPAVIITASNNNPSVGETVIFTATVSGATSTVLRYEWNFGTGAVPATAVTTGNRATASYAATGTKVITVRVVQSSGPSGDGTTAIVVKP